MVKETKFDHHPVRAVKGLSLGSEYLPGQIVYLATQTSAIKTVTSSDDVLWSTLGIDDLLPSGVTRPANAIAAILDVAVNDQGSAGAAAYLCLASPGVIVAGKTTYIYCPPVNDRVGSRLVIVEITGDGKFAYMINATGGVFDYTLKLVGWIIGGELNAPITLPSAELKCTFSVNQ